jgi:phosphoglycolate phosphatase-like HAD superfamily hydrolase
MKLILFDVDGTLLWTDGAGRRAIHRALLAEAGTSGPIDSYRFDGKTDPQIVRDLLTLAGLEQAEIDARMDAVFRRYIELLEDDLQGPDTATRVLPGIPELLTALEPHERDGRIMTGLLTGNLRAGAALKLRSGGLDPARFAVGAFGSDSEHRPELPAIAARRAAERIGRDVPGGAVTIVGDTPQDIACCRPLGARAVAVATGYWSVDELRAAGASRVFADLSATDAVIEALLS